MLNGSLNILKTRWTASYQYTKIWGVLLNLLKIVIHSCCNIDKKKRIIALKHTIAGYICIP